MDISFNQCYFLNKLLIFNDQRLYYILFHTVLSFILDKYSVILSIIEDKIETVLSIIQYKQGMVVI